MRVYSASRQSSSLLACPARGRAIAKTRWNSPMHPIVYFWAGTSVAMLEVGNYIPNPRLIPKDYLLGIFEATSSAI